MCQIEISPYHLQRKKKTKKSSAKAGPDPQKKLYKKKKNRSVLGRLYLGYWFSPANAGPKPRKNRTKQVRFRAGYIWALDFSRAGVTWLWPSAAQAEVTRSSDWSTVDVPGAGTPCYPQVETIPARRIFAAFQFASARIACNFPSRKSAGNGCEIRGPFAVIKKGDKLRLCYNNEFATRTLSLISKDFMMISSCCSWETRQIKAAACS